MSTRILNLRERELMSPACQSVFLSLYDSPTTDKTSLEQALATVLAGLEYFGGNRGTISSAELVDAYSRVEILRHRAIDSPFDFVPQSNAKETYTN